MIYFVNKFALLVANPITIGVVFLIIGVIKRSYCKRWFVIGLAWFLLWGMGITQHLMGYFFGMDRYPFQNVEQVTSADAIVDLGGGVWVRTNICAYPIIGLAADRAAMSARLWKAGKAPIVVPSGLGTKDSDAKFLAELGLPDSAVVVDNMSRNTEENAVCVQELLTERIGAGRRIKVLLVTSISHMPRALMIFKKKAPALECFPVAADFGSVNFFDPISIDDFIPSVGAFMGNMVIYKECLGIIGYKIRGF